MTSGHKRTNATPVFLYDVWCVPPMKSYLSEIMQIGKAVDDGLLFKYQHEPPLIWSGS